MTPAEFQTALILVADSNADSRERMAAATTLLDSALCATIPRQRWRAFRESILAELSRSASNHRTTAKSELRFRQLAAVFLAVQEGGTDVRELRRVMANILSDCLIGPGWNQQRRTTSLEILEDATESASYDPWDDVIDRIDHERQAAKMAERMSTLSDAASQAIQVEMSGETFVSAASHLKKSPGALRVAACRARKKLTETM